MSCWYISILIQEKKQIERNAFGQTREPTDGLSHSFLIN